MSRVLFRVRFYPTRRASFSLAGAIRLDSTDLSGAPESCLGAHVYRAAGAARVATTAGVVYELTCRQHEL